MDWLNLHTSILDDEKLATAEDAHRGVWLHLIRYCIGLENNGRIKSARLWSDRKWLIACRVQKQTLGETSELWSWAEDDLMVWGYPKDKQKEVQAKREGGRIGGIRSAQARAQAQLEANSKKPHTSPTSLGATEWKDKDKDKDKDKSKEKDKGIGGPADRPTNIESVILYFLGIESTEDQAHSFFDHFEANGWLQAGRRPIRSWQAAARTWVRRGKTFGAKNSFGATGAQTQEQPFNPQQPNAHTGGVPIAN